MKWPLQIGLSFVIALSPVLALAGQSVLRVVCDEADSGAEVSINGQFKGECPTVVAVDAGTITVRVERRGSLEVRQFEQTIRLGEGVAQRITAVMTTVLTEEGKRVGAERARQATQKAAAAAAEERAESCANSCSRYNAPGADKCVQDAKNFLGDTFNWNIPKREQCIEEAQNACRKTCS